MIDATQVTTEPDGAPRLASLDILRGVAILGILFMNIEAMGGPLNAFFLQDPRPLGWTGADQIAWWLKDVLAEGTARCLLEMLFGAGMVILTDRAATRMGEWRVVRAYAWRNLVLVLFGLAHVFLLLWPGDILHTYGLAALLVVGLRRLRPRLLLTIGLVLAVGQMVGAGSATIGGAMERQAVTALRAKPAPTATDRQRIAAFDKGEAAERKDRAEALARVATEDADRRGSGRTWVRSLWTGFLWVEGQFLEVLFVWEAASTMLIGAALFKWGVLQGARSRRFYLRMTAIGYAIGLPLRWWGAWALTRFDHAPSLSFAFGEWGRLAMTLGHLGTVVLVARTASGARLLRPFAAAGRTALTIYVLQTIVTMWVLYPPWGFALYGRQGWVALMLTALAIDAALLAWAVWWTRRFAIAPVEWAWRSAVAGRALPWR